MIGWLAAAAGAVALLLSGGASAEDPAAGWTPGRAVEGDGYTYQLFSKQSEGEPFARFRISGRIDAAPAALVRAFRAIVTDPARAPDGQTRRVIANQGNVFIVHARMDLPPLFSDRDIITRGEISVDPATGVQRIDWKAIDDPQAPRVDGTIRIEDAAGAWVFAPTGEHKSNVTYESHVDLGGSLPRWLVQRLMASTVGKTYEDVAAEAGRTAAGSSARTLPIVFADALSSSSFVKQRSTSPPQSLRTCHFSTIHATSPTGESVSAYASDCGRVDWITE